MGKIQNAEKLQIARGASHYDFRVVVGTSLQAGARLATAFIALATVALLARTLDREAFGRYSATIALFQVLDVLVDGGSLQAAVRMVAKNPRCARAAVKAAVRFRLATAALAIVIATILAWALRDPQVPWVTLASFAFFTHAAGVGVAVLHADIDYKQSESLRIVGSLIGLLATVYLVGIGARDAGSMLVAVYAGASLSNLMLAASVKSDIPPDGDAIDTKTFWRASVALGLGGVIRQAYYSANPILARALAGDLAGGRFAPAYRLSGFSILFSVYFGAAALPALVHLYHSDRLQFDRFVKKWSITLALLGATIAGAMYLFREELITTLFGAEYKDSAKVLQPMCLTTVIIYIGGFALTRLIAQGGDGAAIIISFAGLFVNLMTNLSLTSSFGAEGAAWASVAAEATVAAGAFVGLYLFQKRAALRSKEIV